ncbi:MAG: hypothetical protein SW019_10945 [Actinomycetota bacterium]|nr:hypothetical protein [Actinomycetota bacterium]
MRDTGDSAPVAQRTANGRLASVRSRGAAAGAAAVWTVMIVVAPPAPADDNAVFASPSGNIVCMMTVRSASCDVADHDWTGPPVEGDPLCGLQEADRVFLMVNGPAEIHCRNDTLISTEEFTLDYGQSHTVGPLACTSAPSGITCSDTDTGHYFRVSRESYELH